MSWAYVTWIAVEQGGQIYVSNAARTSVNYLVNPVAWWQLTLSDSLSSFTSLGPFGSGSTPNWSDPAGVRFGLVVYSATAQSSGEVTVLFDNVSLVVR